jgi:hypothetical protein
MPSETPMRPAPMPQRQVESPEERDPPREWFPKRNHMTAEEAYLALLAMVLVVALVTAGVWWMSLS